MAADSKNLELIIKAKNEATGAINDVKGDIASLNKAAADAQKQFGNVNAKPINLTAKDNATPTIQGVKGALGGLDDAAATSASAMAALDAVMLLGGAAAAIATITELSRAVWELGQTGAAFSELQGASDALGASFGVNARGMLAVMREAADGTIADSALMLAANRAIVQGVTTNADTMAQLLTEAKARADAFGLSSTQAFETLITGIGNAAPRMLKQLGYTIDAARANDEYAASIGKTAQMLSEQEQRQAILQAVMQQSGKIPSVDSAADSFERMDSAIQNAKEALGVLFGPAVAAVAQQIADMANAATGAFQNMDTGVADSLATVGDMMGRYRQQLQELNDLRAQQVQNNAPTTQTDNEIARVEEQARALGLLKTTIDQANAAYRAGLPGAGEYINRLNAIATAAQNQAGLTDAQVVELSDLNRELAATSTELGTAAAAELNLSGAIQSTNPIIGQQAEKLKQLWLAAAGALGATAAYEGYKSQLDDLTKKQALYNELQRTGLTLPPVEFEQAEVLADAKKQVDDLTKAAQQPVTLELTVKGVSDAAAQKAYSDAIKAGATANEAAQAALGVQVQTTDEINRQVAAWQAAGYDAGQIANVLLPGMRSQLTATNSALSDTQKRFDDIKSAAEGVLQGALNVDVGVEPEDILDKLGMRPEAVNENARRLAAIARDGLQGQEWLPDFAAEAPQAYAELMRAAVSGVDVRGTAAQMLIDFQDGLRPDLLDKGKAKDLVRRAILGDASTAAMAQEIAAELSQEMGISLAAAQAAANTALGVKPANGEGGAQGTGAQMVITPVVSFGEEAEKQAAKLGETIKKGLESEMSLKALGAAGMSAAESWGSAFLTVVGENVPPQLIEMLTSLITPKVKAALVTGGSQTGAQP